MRPEMVTELVAVVVRVTKTSTPTAVVALPVIVAFVLGVPDTSKGVSAVTVP
jgi:hypothetical protein